MRAGGANAPVSPVGIRSPFRPLGTLGLENGGRRLRAPRRPPLSAD